MREHCFLHSSNVMDSPSTPFGLQGESNEESHSAFALLQIETPTDDPSFVQRQFALCSMPFDLISVQNEPLKIVLPVLLEHKLKRRALYGVSSLNLIHMANENSFPKAG